jgi:hypothetical protein
MYVTESTQSYDCSGTDDICYFYLFSYALFLDTCLNLAVIVLYLFTTYYEHMVRPSPISIIIVFFYI